MIFDDNPTHPCKIEGIVWTSLENPREAHRFFRNNDDIAFTKGLVLRSADRLKGPWNHPRFDAKQNLMKRFMF